MILFEWLGRDSKDEVALVATKSLLFRIWRKGDVPNGRCPTTAPPLFLDKDNPSTTVVVNVRQHSQPTIRHHQW